MNNISDTKRLADAIDSLAVTMMGIVGERLKAIADAQERRIARQTVEPMLTKKQVADHSQVDVRTITIWLERGYLSYCKASHSVRFKGTDVQKYWDARFRVTRGRPGF
jgi:hypothetical protein